MLIAVKWVQKKHTFQSNFRRKCWIILSKYFKNFKLPKQFQEFYMPVLLYDLEYYFFLKD